MKISKSRLHLLILVSVVVIVIIAFWFFIYSPNRKTLRELSSQLEDIDEGINLVKGIVGDEKTLDKAVAEYDARLKDFKSKLPSKEETTLRQLAIIASDMGIEIVSITPQMAEESTVPIAVPGYKCMEMPISLNLESDYKTIGEYIGILEKQFSALIILNRLKMHKTEQSSADNQYDSPDLTVDMSVTFYMLVPVE